MGKSLEKWRIQLTDYPLLTRMILYIFLFGVAMTASLSCLKLYLVYGNDVENLKKHLESIEESHRQVLAKNVWNFNEETLVVQLDSILQHPDIIFLQLDTPEKQYSTGQRPNGRQTLLTNEFPIYINFKGKQSKIADFTILATTSHIQQRLVGQLPGIIVVEFIKMIFVCVFILLLFYLLFNRHLLQIADYTKTIDFYSLDQPLVFANRKIQQDNPDELDRIVTAINDMRQRLQDDILQRQKLESELQQAQKMEAIGTLAGGIAHDFNNILTAIFGYTDLAMLHKDNNEKLQDDLVEVRKGAERAKGLVQQILTFSRKSDHSKRPLQVSLIVKEVVKLLRSSIPSSIDIQQEINVVEQAVLADPTQIHQILMNLATNAYHAMAKTGGTLAISLQAKIITVDDLSLAEGLVPGQYLELEVSDTGTGMDKATREKIFEPYFTTKEAGQGTGLGLAVVHGIVRDHQGAIHVYSEPGEGSCFRIYLPVIVGKAVVEERPDKVVVNVRGKGTLLYVDDEEKILDLAQEFFTSSGYQINTFSRPKDALAAFAENPEGYDLLISDMTMPGMTGMELATGCMTLRPELPVIICSGHSELINRESALAQGIAEYISKPLVMSKLLASVQEIL